MSLELNQSPTTLNAMLNLFDEDHKIQFDKDKEAARQFFLQDINKNTVYFNSLEEKVEHLVENKYWEEDFIRKYSMHFIKDLFKELYGYKHRFKTYLGALKFYNQYALKTRDGSRYLERYEDRCAAVGLYLGQGDEKLARDIAVSILKGQFQPATPTFQNSGKYAGGGLTSCFLLDMQDSLESIGRTLDSAMVLSKNGGGIGVNFTNIREAGAPIKGIEGLSSGVIPILKVYEDAVTRFANQLGQRQGALVANLNIFHPDILQFLDTKKENADEGIRMRLLSIAVLIPDIFMEEAAKNHDIFLISPYEIAREYGITLSDFDITARYQELLDNPRISKKRKINARVLLSKIAEVAAESGYPYMIFIDTANKSMAVDGRIKMSNLCVTGDTMLLTSEGYKSMEELYNSQEEIKVLSDNRIVDDNVNSTGLSIFDSTPVFKTAENAPVFKIKTKTGRELKTTGYHKMFIQDGKSVVKKEVLDLNPGDKLFTQSGLGCFGSIHKPDLAYIAGLIASDGSFMKRTLKDGTKSESALIFLYGSKQELSDSILRVIKSILFNRTDLINKQATIQPEYAYNPKVDRLQITSAPLAKALAEYNFTSETKLKIPDFVLHGDMETQVNYLSGVYQMDSCITGSTKNKNISIELGSINFEFLQGIQNMLINLNVYSRIYVSKAEDSKEELPNGYGGTSLYNQHRSWSLRVTSQKDAIELYNKLVWRKSQMDKFENIISNKSKKKAYNTHRYTDIIESIEYLGLQPVYDVTVSDNSHSIITNGIVTGNCSEIFQPQTPSTFNEDFSYDTVGTDVACNLGSLIIDGVMDSGEPGRIIETAVRGLTNVANLLNEPGAPTVSRGNKEAHSIGISAMNLHGYLAREGIMYGDYDALEFVSSFFAMLRYHALRASNIIARETGQTFVGFNKSKYASGEFFDKYVENDYNPTREKVIALYEKAGITLPSHEDWLELKENVMLWGLYNRELMCVPPTGSISYIQSASPGLMPIPAPVEIRKEGMIGRVYYPAPYLTDDNLHLYKDAYELGYEAIINTFAKAQEHIDQGCSMNLYFEQQNTNTRQIVKAYIYAWKSGLKSTYYVRFQQRALQGTELDCVSCSI